MSNIFRSEKLDEDYKAFAIDLFKTNDFIFKLSEKNTSQFKKFHRLTYALALVNLKLEENYKDYNKHLFVSEIISDLLSSLSLTFLGFNLAANVLLRRITENFYNHIYYFDHPVEFQNLNQGKNEYIPLIDLKKYFETYPFLKFKEDPLLKKYNDQIFNSYQELCRFVHTKGYDFMGLAKNIMEIKSKDTDVIDQLNKFNQVSSGILYCIFKFHRNLQYNHFEKDIIAKSFTKSERSSLLN